jgi:hypothetical protein
MDVATKLRRAHAMGSSNYRDASSTTLYSEGALEIHRLIVLLEEITDSEECWFDHHGGCQAHGFLGLQPGELCPVRDAQQTIRAYTDNAGEREQYMPDPPNIPA